MTEKKRFEYNVNKNTIECDGKSENVVMDRDTWHMEYNVMVQAHNEFLRECEGLEFYDVILDMLSRAVDYLMVYGVENDYFFGGF